MDIYDNEIEIIKALQSIDTKEVLLLPENDTSAEQIYLSVLQKWEKWTNSSGKSDPPPDFFCDELGLMMDVMRIDDHGHIGCNGKSIINPTLQRESEVMRELREKGGFEIFPNAKPYLIVDTKLPTDEDHNYNFYRDNFNRVVSAHIRKIPNYKANHPGLKTIFLVFDEASPYFERLETHTVRRVGDVESGKPHLWFEDDAFVSLIKDSDIEYLIWFTPYKYCDMFDAGCRWIKLPKVTVINTKSINSPFIQYKTSNMVSTEL